MISWVLDARRAAIDGVVFYQLSGSQLLKPGESEVVVDGLSVDQISERFLPALWSLRSLPGVANVVATQYKVAVHATTAMEWLFSLRGEVAAILAMCGGETLAQVTHGRDGDFPTKDEFSRAFMNQTRCAGCASSGECEEASGRELIPAEVALETFRKNGFGLEYLTVQIADDQVVIIPTKRPRDLRSIAQLDQLFGLTMPAIRASTCAGTATELKRHGIVGYPVVQKQ